MNVGQVDASYIAMQVGIIARTLRSPRLVRPAAWSIALACATATASTTAAVDVQPGTRYEGEVRLDFLDLGASFVLPAGWAGALPAAGGYFVMEGQSFPGYTFAVMEETSVEEAQSLMGDAIDLGGGIVLRPTGAVAVEGTLLTASYAVSGAARASVGEIRAIVGEHGWGVAFIGTCPAESLSALSEVLDAMSRSLVLGPLPELSSAASVRPAAPRAGDGAASGGPWFGELSGYKLSHFYTRTGYTEEDYIWLCSDGRFYKSFHSGGFGGGASGAFESKDGGQWMASGPMEGGTLALAFNDGSVSRYALTREGTKLFLDGKRYFRETGGCLE